jgi:CubicO group peptidase (beta-lactamase class C family)
MITLMRRISLWLSVLCVFPGIIHSAEVPLYAKVPRMTAVAAAYKAKILCSAVFVSKRNHLDVEKAELQAFPFPAKIDEKEKMVTVSVGMGMPDAVAIFREGLGCTGGINYTLEHVRAQVTGNPTPPPADPSVLSALSKPWPEGDGDDYIRANLSRLYPEVDKDKLMAAIDKAFTEPYAAQKKIWGTRAVVVVYKGRIIAERYAPGFTADTPLIGWSMTKSITNSLIGILVKQGKLNLKAQASVPTWNGKDDPRAAITLDQLLRMSDGLDFVEDYVDLLSDTPFMLFGTPDTAAFTAAKPLEVPPDSRWRYISGNPNIVCRIIRDAVGGPLAQYFAFPRRSLFDKIGMRSAVLEPDAAGTFVGSSFSYATARDWARFGLLYLRDGVWMNERILPEGWIKYTTTPTPKAPKGEYGAYWWLNAGSPLGSANRFFPSLPPDLYQARGYEGQDITVLPSRDIVVVHLGAASPPDAWNPEEFIADILKAIK